MNFAGLKILHTFAALTGTMAEWLGSGLQNRVQQFESAWYLKKESQLNISADFFLSNIIPFSFDCVFACMGCAPHLPAKARSAEKQMRKPDYAGSKWLPVSANCFSIRFAR